MPLPGAGLWGQFYMKLDGWQSVSGKWSNVRLYEAIFVKVALNRMA
jgi:hypothetical protein